MKFRCSDRYGLSQATLPSLSTVHLLALSNKRLAMAFTAGSAKSPNAGGVLSRHDASGIDGKVQADANAQPTIAGLALLGAG
jgi:hypothetical protein